MRKTLLFIDGNFYMNRAWHVLHTQNDIGRALGALMVSMICRDAIRVKATHLLVGFDGMSFRYGLYDGYKQSRKVKTQGKSKSDETTKEIYTYMADVQKYLERCGITFEHPPKHEADDLGAVCAALASPKLRVVIGTKDKDSMQLLKDNVVMYDSSVKPPKDPYKRAEAVVRKFGVEAHQMVDYQTLVGDKGDSIPNLKPFGPAKAVALLKKYGSLKKWSDKAPKSGQRWINLNRENMMRNRKLVRLVDDCVEINIKDLVVPKLTKDTKFYPSAWHDYQAMLYPKSKGLF